MGEVVGGGGHVCGSACAFAVPGDDVAAYDLGAGVFRRRGRRELGFFFFFFFHVFFDEVDFGFIRMKEIFPLLQKRGGRRAKRVRIRTGHVKIDVSPLSPPPYP